MRILYREPWLGVNGGGRAPLEAFCPNERPRCRGAMICLCNVGYIIRRSDVGSANQRQPGLNVFVPREVHRVIGSWSCSWLIKMITESGIHRGFGEERGGELPSCRWRLFLMPRFQSGESHKLLTHTGMPHSLRSLRRSLRKAAPNVLQCATISRAT